MDLLKSQIRLQITQLRASSSTVQQTLEDHLPSWQRALSDRFGLWFQWFFADFLKNKIEKEFDLNHFLEGAKDAFWIVHRLIGQEDYATLKTMVSKKLADAVETTGAEYRAGGLIWRTEIDGDTGGMTGEGEVTGPIIDAQLRRITLWNRDQIAEYDEEQAALQPENVDALTFPSGRWLILYVQYHVKQNTIITREEDGQVVAKLTDKRPALWTFASGPLPEGLPVQNLDTPFWLLKFD